MNRQHLPGAVDILRAQQRIRGFVQTTPLERSAQLSNHCDADVLLKYECAQTTGSFKLRGATNALRSLPAGSHVITCSAGNHALGVAHAAAALNMHATIVLPTWASAAKVEALRRYPVELLMIGASYDEAEAHALTLAAEQGRQFISPYNDSAVIAGQGTLALEVLEQAPEIDTLIVAVGGGGLASGVGLWCRAVNPAMRIIGVQAEHSAAMHASLQAGRIVTTRDDPTLADGLAGGIEPGSITFPLVQRLIDDIVLVSEAEIAAAMRWLIDEHHVIVEGSGAVPLAALLHGRIDIRSTRTAVLLCGRNVSHTVLQRVMNEAGGPQPASAAVG
jgi:threonine dehydratase